MLQERFPLFIAVCNVEYETSRLFVQLHSTQTSSEVTIPLRTRHAVIGTSAKRDTIKILPSRHRFRKLQASLSVLTQIRRMEASLVFVHSKPKDAYLHPILKHDELCHIQQQPKDYSQGNVKDNHQNSPNRTILAITASVNLSRETMRIIERFQRGQSDSSADPSRSNRDL